MLKILIFILLCRPVKHLQSSESAEYINLIEELYPSTEGITYLARIPIQKHFKPHQVYDNEEMNAPFCFIPYQTMPYAFTNTDVMWSALIIYAFHSASQTSQPIEDYDPAQSLPSPIYWWWSANADDIGIYSWYKSDLEQTISILYQVFHEIRRKINRIQKLWSGIGFKVVMLPSVSQSQKYRKRNW